MDSLKNHLLIAMPALADPEFKQGVVYICEHHQDGAMGIMINKPMRITLGEVLKHLSITVEDKQVEGLPVLSGGPVSQEQGFIIHRIHDFPSTVPLIVLDDIAISTSKALLEDIVHHRNTDEFVVSLGYSAWNPNQLEEEIAKNTWLVAPANDKILFHLPFAKRWKAAAQSIGINLMHLSQDVGHA